MVARLGQEIYIYKPLSYQWMWYKLSCDPLLGYETNVLGYNQCFSWRSTRIETIRVHHNKGKCFFMKHLLVCYTYVYTYKHMCGCGWMYYKVWTIFSLRTIVIKICKTLMWTVFRALGLNEITWGKSRKKRSQYRTLGLITIQESGWTEGTSKEDQDGAASAYRRKKRKYGITDPREESVSRRL